MPQIAHHKPVEPRLRVNAKRMRQTTSDAEAAMWRLLRDRRFVGLKFRRQVPFHHYILDFACFERRLVIEIDGSQHLNSPRDAVRDRLLQVHGFRTLRYWNNDVLSRPSAVLEDIFAHVTTADADPSLRAGRGPARPSPTRGEGGRARGKD